MSGFSKPWSTACSNHYQRTNIPALINMDNALEHITRKTLKMLRKFERTIHTHTHTHTISIILTIYLRRFQRPKSFVIFDAFAQWPQNSSHSWCSVIDSLSERLFLFNGKSHEFFAVLGFQVTSYSARKINWQARSVSGRLQAHCVSESNQPITM